MGTPGSEDDPLIVNWNTNTNANANANTNTNANANANATPAKVTTKDRGQDAGKVRPPDAGPRPKDRGQSLGKPKPEAPGPAAKKPSEDTDVSDWPNQMLGPSNMPEPSTPPPKGTGLDKDALGPGKTLNSVLGRPVTDDFSLVNQGTQPITIVPTLEGDPVFDIGTVLQIPLGGTQGKENAAKLPITYRPTRAGEHSAVLVLNQYSDTAAIGAVRVPLKGTATDIGNHAKTEAAGGGAEPVHEMPDNPAPIHDSAQARSQLLDAADSLSALTLRYRSLLPQADAAIGGMINRCRTAGAGLNARIITWVAQEGMDFAHKQNNKGHGGEAFRLAVGQLLESTAKAAELENPVVSLVFKAVDLGWDIVDGISEDHENDETEEGFDERLGKSSAIGAAGAASATEALVARTTSLQAAYSAAKGAVAECLAETVNDRIGSIHEQLSVVAKGDTANAARTVHSASEAIATMKSKEATMNNAVHTAAIISAHADEVAENGFKRLMDQYIAARAGKQEGQAKLSIAGSMWFGDGPSSIHIDSVQFGEFRDPTETVKPYIDDKRIADLKEWETTITLRGVSGTPSYQDGGELVLFQIKGGQRGVMKNEGIPLSGIGGVEGVWGLLDSGTLGTRDYSAGKK